MIDDKTDIIAISPEVVTEAAQPVKKPGRPNGSKHSRLAQYRAKERKIINKLAQMPDATNYQIALATNTQPTTVRNIRIKFDKWFKELKNVKQFNEEKPELLSAAQLAVLKSMLTDDKLKKASLKDCAISFGVLYDKGRLEAGQSTNNQSVAINYSNKTK